MQGKYLPLLCNWNWYAFSLIILSFVSTWDTVWEIIPQSASHRTRIIAAHLLFEVYYNMPINEIMQATIYSERPLLRIISKTQWFEGIFSFLQIIYFITSTTYYFEWYTVTLTWSKLDLYTLKLLLLYFFFVNNIYFWR